ncbi:unnamed protein product [Victoria cruziana]
MKGGKSKAATAKKAESKLGVKRKAAASDRVGKRAAKKGKDPNKPKRPPSAFFVFMEEFRKQYQEKNPNNKSVAAVGKAAGDKWKSMSESDKAPYAAKSAKRKAEYEKSMVAYNKKQAAGSDNDEEESDKSKSEVNDEEEESNEEEDED